MTGSRPDKALSPDDFLLVGGWFWWPITDAMRLKVPQIFQGRKQKGKYKPGTIFLDNPVSKLSISTFYTDYPVTLAHILSRTAALYDQAGAISPISG